MDVRMASHPGCSLVGEVGGYGRGSWSSGYITGKNIKHPVAPQVTLDISVHPPTLDTAGSKPSLARPSSGFCGSTKKAGAQLWTSIRNAYNSIRSGPSLTWVNPGMIYQECHPAAMPQPVSPEAQYPMLEASYVDQPLWFQATSESQFGYQDPLLTLSYPFSGSAVPIPYTTNCFNPVYSKQKASKPLNPEAKEWVPNNYGDDKSNKSSIPNSSTVALDKKFFPSGTNADMSSDFIEITQDEIDEVCKNSFNHKPKKPQPQDHTINEYSNKSYPEHTTSCSAALDEPCVTLPKGSLCVNGFCSKQNTGCDLSSMIEMVDPFAENSKETSVSPPEIRISTDQNDESLSLSYASIIRKSPEPPPQTMMKIRHEGQSISPSSAKQPLPKIFMKDKKYPKEKAPLSMETKRRDPLPFKTASKTQKKSSRKFLKDLREMSPTKSDTSFSGSEGSIESNSDIMARLGMSGSPIVIGLFANELLKEKCGHSPQSVKSQRSMSESSASSSHVRTLSESTMGSVESIDIEFGEDYEILDKDENPCSVAGKSVSKSVVCRKNTNSILAHILGFDDSESENSDDDDSSDESDWDTVQECVSVDNVDSWEACGLMIPFITKSLPCPKLTSNDKPNNSENICDTECNLDDVNKRWDDEICKDVCTASRSRVSFGKVRIFPMVSWSYAYRTARRGPWEQYARDRSRFNNRILTLEPILSPVLTDDHRRRMYCKIYGL